MEATHGNEGATTERLMGILGWSEDKATSDETTQPEAAEKAKPEETQEQQTESTESEEATEQSETTEEAEQTDDAQEEVSLPSTLSELAEVLGIDPDKLYEIKAKTKIDGQEGEATLAQLLKSYQLEGHLTRKSMELSERQKALEQDAQRHQAEATQRLQYLEDSIAVATNLLNERYQGVDWDALKASDANAFNTRYIEYQQHRQKLANAFQAVQAEREKQSLANQQKFAEYVAGEGKALANAIPEWADAKVAKKERTEIREYLKGIGYDDSEVDQIYDHRLVLVVRDAMKAKRLATAKPEILKKITQAPKLVKPGTKSTKQEGLRDRLRDLRKQHRSGNKKAGVNYLIESGLAD